MLKTYWNTQELDSKNLLHSEVNTVEVRWIHPFVYGYGFGKTGTYMFATYDVMPIQRRLCIYSLGPLRSSSNEGHWRSCHWLERQRLAPTLTAVLFKGRKLYYYFNGSSRCLQWIFLIAQISSRNKWPWHWTYLLSETWYALLTDCVLEFTG